MSAKQIYRLVHRQARAGAQLAITNAPDGWIVTVAEPTRTLEQNAKLWPMLTDVSRQVDWYGQRLTPEEWKDVFSAALKAQKVVPGLNGGFVVCGQSTSKMGKREFSDLLEVMFAFGAEKGVQWSEPVPAWGQAA
jgi:hypothetical protein